MPKNRVNQKEVKRTATKSAMCGQDELVLEPKIIQICEENHVGSNQRARDLNVPFGQNVHAAMGPSNPINVGGMIYWLDPHDYRPNQPQKGHGQAAIPYTNLAQPEGIQLVPPWTNSRNHNPTNLDTQ